MTGPTYLFLDTEWADEAGTELVSLALVSEDGQRTFYAERKPLPLVATDFVRRTVYPLLDRGRAALPDAAMTAALRQLLLGIDHPYVQADYPNDLRLFEVVLAGFDTVADERTACDAFPSPVMTLMVREGRTTALLEDWFQRDDGEQLPAVHDNDRSYDTSDRALQAGRELGRRVIDRAG